MNRAGLPVAGFALIVAAGAAVLLLVALQIPVRAVDMLWGPRLFPVAIMVALVLTGVSVAVLELFFSGGEERPAEPNNWKAMAFVLAGLLLFGILVEPLGFVIAAAALFVSVSRGFGSERLALDAAIGVLLGATIYILFARVLGLYLPGGSIFFAFAGQ
jgi:putative tricarboxylic transport membrane protein